MDSNFGMIRACPLGLKMNTKYRGKRGQRQCLKGGPKITLAMLRKIAKAKEISIYKRRKDGLAFTRTPLSMKALKSRITRVTGKGNYFGMATVCMPGKHPNPKWKKGRGERQCLTNKVKMNTLPQLRKLAKSNDVSIYKRRKDGMGFTRTPLTMKALKYRLTKMKVNYKM